MIKNSQDDNSGVLESSRSPAEALRQLKEQLCVFMIGAAYDDLSSHDKSDVDDAMELVTAYAATVEREAAIREVKNCREGFVIGYQRYEGNEAADKFLKTIIEAFDDRLAALQGTEELQGDSK